MFVLSVIIITFSFFKPKFSNVNKKSTSTLDRVTKALKNTPEQLAKGGKQIIKKAGKFFPPGKFFSYS